jgi:hypothetical protein
MRVRRARATFPRTWMIASSVTILALVAAQPSKEQSCTSGTPQHSNGPIRQLTAGSLCPPFVNGYVYIPTAGISTVASNSHATCSTSVPCSGVLVYSGH